MAFTYTAHGFSFADGGSGRNIVNPDGPPAAGDFEVLWANSDGIVNQPTDFATGASRVNNQGGYLFTRQADGSETDTINITTPQGNVNCRIIWLRVSGALAIDVIQMAGVDGSIAASSPAFTSTALAQANEAAFFGILLHSFSAGIPTAVNWSTGYTTMGADGNQGTGGTGTFSAIAVKDPAGPGAESPTATWTNATGDRYVGFVSFTLDTTTGIDLDTQPGDPAPDGTPTTLTMGRLLAAQPGAASPDGAPAALTMGTLLAGQPGASHPDGTPTALTMGTALAGQPGAAHPDGTPTALTIGTALAGQPGAASPDGTPTALTMGTALTAQPGTASPDGAPAALVLNAGTITLNAQPGDASPAGGPAALTGVATIRVPELGGTATTLALGGAASVLGLGGTAEIA